MCFSATASFVTAGVTGLAGAYALTRVDRWRDAPLAATPLLFALQQGVEGLLWLELPRAPAGPLAAGLTLLYLLLAQVFWPVYAPAAALLAEPSATRRRLIAPLLLVGAAVGASLLWNDLTHPASAAVLNCHVVYATGAPASVGLEAAYLAAVSLPLLLSTRRALQALGVIVLAGCVATYLFYWQAFLSVWCFFAAAGSVVIVAHFDRARRRRRALAVA